ncbi:MAG: hypothetical protein V3U65_17475 [Granulosicoccaceae bacterium]
MKFVWAGLLGVFIWRMIPTARHWLKNGPRGSSKEWMTTAMLLGGVVLFVLILMKSV